MSGVIFSDMSLNSPLHLSPFPRRNWAGSHTGQPLHFRLRAWVGFEVPPDGPSHAKQQSLADALCSDGQMRSLKKDTKNSTPLPLPGGGERETWGHRGENNREGSSVRSQNLQIDTQKTTKINEQIRRMPTAGEHVFLSPSLSFCVVQLLDSV